MTPPDLHPADQHEASISEQVALSKDALCDAIEGRYQVLVAITGDIVEKVKLQANAARELGLLLIELKAVSHRDFGKLFSSDSNGARNPNPRFVFSYNWGNTFMRFAASQPNEISELPEAVSNFHQFLIAAGVLAEPKRLTQSTHPLQGLSELQRIFMSGLSIIGKQCEKLGIMSNWPRTELERTETLLRPYAEKHAETLKALEAAQ